MNRSKIIKYSPWVLAPLIGAAAMLSFLYFRNHRGESFEPPAAVGGQGQPVAAEKLQEARDFKEWPLYWLGESFDSLPLTGIDFLTPEQGMPTMRAVSFIYGTCTPPPDAGGCAAPLNIQVDPLSFIPPEKISGVTRGDLFDFRGAKAVWVDDHLRIWTGDSTIAIFGHPRERIEKAAQEIVPLGNLAAALSDSNLPPPNFH